MLPCEKNRCTGCRACAALCPAGAIEMRFDEEGFLAPEINETRCTECGLCASICPQANAPVRAGEIKHVYAAKYADDAVLAQCTSGGAFHVFASDILSRGGVVFGCAYDERIRAHHVEIASMEALSALYGSKYVQSDTEHTYEAAKARLDAGVPVLYSGTPCQIAGLDAFLGKPYENLVTVELLCMGVPSPGLFAAYLAFREAQLGEKVERFAFRTKDKTKWGVSMALRLGTKTKTVYHYANVDPYKSAFLKGYTLRESCYNCRHRERARTGDLTICDYWGIDAQHPAFYSTKGVSGVTVNSDKGMALLARVRGRLELLETDEKSISEENKVFFRSKRRPPERDKAYAGGITPEMFRENPVFRPTLFDRLFTALPACLKPYAKKLRRAWTRFRYQRKPVK